MTKIKDITDYLESFAPLYLQESYDNSGLLVGDNDKVVNKVLISLDCTEKVVEEAIAKGCNLIISHHPIIFRGLKSLTGSNYVERTVLKAIQNDIALYAIHTNLDNVSGGVNSRICEILNIKAPRILIPKSDLTKIVTFIPRKDLGTVTKAMYQAGAGNIGNYEHCSFQVEGIGTFRPNEESDPHLGEIGKNSNVEEVRVEMVLPQHSVAAVIASLKDSHPYDEVAYYLQELQNKNQDYGSGMIGQLDSSMSGQNFLEYIKNKMELRTIRHTPLISRDIQTVAVCGGSGSFTIPAAIRSGADALVTADIKYHEFFDADENILLADIGHYESERFTKDLLHDIICEKFTTFAVILTETVTNPISYF